MVPLNIIENLLVISHNLLLVIVKIWLITFSFPERKINETELERDGELVNFN